jgi:hypothetical protein
LLKIFDVVLEHHGPDRQAAAALRIRALGVDRSTAIREAFARAGYDEVEAVNGGFLARACAVTPSRGRLLKGLLLSSLSEPSARLGFPR